MTATAVSTMPGRDAHVPNSPGPLPPDGKKLYVLF